MTAPVMTSAQRLAQAGKKVELAFHNLETANRRGMSDAVLDKLITKHADAIAAYRALQGEIGDHVGRP